MTLDWSNFTPWISLAGGLMIGLAAALFMLFNGKIAGISGIVGGLLSPARGDVAWRIAFIAGLVISPLIFALAVPLPKVQVEASYPVLLIAGLLVGIGTRYGAGCTSGHGVCGLSRRSPRSMVATIAFMFAGFVTVYIVRHLIG
ncbi:YeeE/YedE family protein [Noviherbaspirillum aerium]|uniref:YeeE/YedE family protein n=1 Tax=Noviherbaspirillum aerium TaxID=2588497 RepID=UPI0021F4FA6A|nr:YeeE/YedE family protein [Noviherbaspirillum aerium]